jgi:hypothetical protein
MEWKLLILTRAVIYMACHMTFFDLHCKVGHNLGNKLWRIYPVSTLPIMNFCRWHFFFRYFQTVALKAIILILLCYMGSKYVYTHYLLFLHTRIKILKATMNTVYATLFYIMSFIGRRSVFATCFGSVEPSSDNTNTIFTKIITPTTDPLFSV